MTIDLVAIFVLVATNAATLVLLDAFHRECKRLERVIDDYADELYFGKKHHGPMRWTRPAGFWGLLTQKDLGRR